MVHAFSPWLDLGSILEQCKLIIFKICNLMISYRAFPELLAEHDVVGEHILKIKVNTNHELLTILPLMIT